MKFSTFPTNTTITPSTNYTTNYSTPYRKVTFNMNRKPSLHELEETKNSYDKLKKSYNKLQLTLRVYQFICFLLIFILLVSPTISCISYVGHSAGCLYITEMGNYYGWDSSIKQDYDRVQMEKREFIENDKVANFISTLTGVWYLDFLQVCFIFGVLAITFFDLVLMVHAIRLVKDCVTHQK